VLTGVPDVLMYFKDTKPMGERELNWSNWFGVALLGQAAIMKINLDAGAKPETMCKAFLASYCIAMTHGAYRTFVTGEQDTTLMKATMCVVAPTMIGLNYMASK
jgi:hypothetical protein